MNDSRCFVQFIHPGGEHAPDESDTISWNTGDHKRKFMKAAGKYLAEDRVHEGALTFWGEWEPESRVIERYEPSGRATPNYLWEPYFTPPTTDEWRQNTDPFVFDGAFLYTGCKQHKGGRPTQLRYLSSGSLVLFGSCVQSRFVLDTAFVVSRHVDHAAENHAKVLASVTSDMYRVVTIEPWYGWKFPQGQSHRLYFGATIDAPVSGMFSFFPCQPHEGGRPGFARPTIELPEWVTPTLRQGEKIQRDVEPDHLSRLWQEVVRQVTRQGLALGLQAVIP